MRYDLLPEPAATPETVVSVYGEEADASNFGAVHEEPADVPGSASVGIAEDSDVPNPAQW